MLILDLFKSAAQKLRGRKRLGDLDIAIETREGEQRYWTDGKTGEHGATVQPAPYGYVRGTVGLDGEGVDCYVVPGVTPTEVAAREVYAILTAKPPDFTQPDEFKCIIGAASEAEARALFAQAYDDPRFFVSLDRMPWTEFVQWMRGSATPDSALRRKSLSYEEETEAILASKKSPAAFERHRFRAAQWTHKNGHPRCRVCGDEERVGGWCEPVAKAVILVKPHVRDGHAISGYVRREGYNAEGFEDWWGAWISPAGEVTDLRDEHVPGVGSREPTHAEWLAWRHPELVPPDADKYRGGYADKVVGAALAAGWIRQADEHTYLVAGAADLPRVYDYVMEHLPHVQTITVALGLSGAGIDYCVKHRRIAPCRLCAAGKSVILVKPHLRGGKPVRGYAQRGRDALPERAHDPAGELEPEGSAPDVAWYRGDLQDSDQRVTPESIQRDYGARDFGATVYQSYISLSDLDEKLAEEEEAREHGDDEEFEPVSYDWSELQSGGSPPPIKVARNVDGSLTLLDGNHRVRFWRENDYEYAPAWVIDYQRWEPRVAEKATRTVRVKPHTRKGKPVRGYQEQRKAGKARGKKARFGPPGQPLNRFPGDQGKPGKPLNKWSPTDPHFWGDAPEESHDPIAAAESMLRKVREAKDTEARKQPNPPPSGPKPPPPPAPPPLAAEEEKQDYGWPQFRAKKWTDEQVGAVSHALVARGFVLAGGYDPADSEMTFAKPDKDGFRVNVYVGKAGWRVGPEGGEDTRSLAQALNKRFNEEVVPEKDMGFIPTSAADRWAAEAGERLARAAKPKLPNTHGMKWDSGTRAKIAAVLQAHGWKSYEEGAHADYGRYETFEKDGTRVTLTRGGYRLATGSDHGWASDVGAEEGTGTIGLAGALGIDLETSDDELLRKLHEEPSTLKLTGSDDRRYGRQDAAAILEQKGWKRQPQLDWCPICHQGAERCAQIHEHASQWMHAYTGERYSAGGKISENRVSDPGTTHTTVYLGPHRWTTYGGHLYAKDSAVPTATPSGRVKHTGVSHTRGVGQLAGETPRPLPALRPEARAVQPDAELPGGPGTLDQLRGFIGQASPASETSSELGGGQDEERSPSHDEEDDGGGGLAETNGSRDPSDYADLPNDDAVDPSDNTYRGWFDPAGHWHKMSPNGGEWHLDWLAEQGYVSGRDDSYVPLLDAGWVRVVDLENFEVGSKQFFPKVAEYVRNTWHRNDLKFVDVDVTELPSGGGIARGRNAGQVGGRLLGNFRVCVRHGEEKCQACWKGTRYATMKGLEVVPAHRRAGHAVRGYVRARTRTGTSELPLTYERVPVTRAAFGLPEDTSDWRFYDQYGSPTQHAQAGVEYVRAMSARTGVTIEAPPDVHLADLIAAYEGLLPFGAIFRRLGEEPSFFAGPRQPRLRLTCGTVHHAELAPVGAASVLGVTDPKTGIVELRARPRPNATTAYPPLPDTDLGMGARTERMRTTVAHEVGHLVWNAILTHLANQRAVSLEDPATAWSALGLGNLGMHVQGLPEHAKPLWERIEAFIHASCDEGPVSHYVAAYHPQDGMDDDFGRGIKLPRAFNEQFAEIGSMLFADPRIQRSVRHVPAAHRKTVAAYQQLLAWAAEHFSGEPWKPLAESGGTATASPATASKRFAGASSSWATAAKSCAGSTSRLAIVLAKSLPPIPFACPICDFEVPAAAACVVCGSTLAAKGILGDRMLRTPAPATKKLKRTDTPLREVTFALTPDGMQALRDVLRLVRSAVGKNGIVGARLKPAPEISVACKDAAALATVQKELTRIEGLCTEGEDSGPGLVGFRCGLRGLPIVLRTTSMHQHAADVASLQDGSPEMDQYLTELGQHRQYADHGVQSRRPQPPMRQEAS